MPTHAHASMKMHNKISKIKTIMHSQSTEVATKLKKIEYILHIIII